MYEAEPEPAAVSPPPQAPDDQYTDGGGGQVLSAAELERRLLVGASQSCAKGETQGESPVADWQNLPEDQIQELELILGRLVEYDPSLRASGTVQSQSQKRDGRLGAEDELYGLKLKDLLRLLVQAVRPTCLSLLLIL